MASQDLETGKSGLNDDGDGIAPSRSSHHGSERVESTPDGTQSKTATPTRWARKARVWIKGPEPPRTHRITPILERWQTLPARWLARLPRWVRVVVYGVACMLWAVVFGLVVRHGGLPANIGGRGAPVRLGCVTTLWPSPQACGLDGRNCLPFANASFAFNCPAGCLSAQVLNPRAIGPSVINYRPQVVGGMPDAALDDALVYRGDSFICGAAIHAGVLTNGKGGCGVLSLAGESSNFGAVSRNGISSIGFDSSFPLSFTFNTTSPVVQASSKCQDPRWNLLVLSTISTALFGLCTTSPPTFFAPIFTILFFQVSMASDPPSYSTYASLASTALGRFLPAALAAALFYQWSVRKTLLHCRAPVEKTVLWVGGAWVGALANYTFERIPIQRLTGHDIRQQPGAITALVVIVLVVLAAALYQAWCLRLEGRLPHFLCLYALIGLSLGLLAALPHLTLRIHHYIIALLLLPGTSLQTRISMLSQGLLVGLFVNGVARWGFDPIVQTAAALRGDAQLGSGIPVLAEPLLINASSIVFSWPAVQRGYHAVSVLVNDVERLRGGIAPASPLLSEGQNTTNSNTFTWTRRALNANDYAPEYFRFGFITYAPFGTVAYSDFTRAATWWPNGSWTGIPPGRT